MGLLAPLSFFVTAPRRHEYAIRYRLLRASLSLQARRAERRADHLLVSYPKCGRTWLTMLLARALAEHAGLDDEEIDYLATDLLEGRAPDLPRIRISHDDAPHWKTPAGLRRSKRRYRDKGVIFLVRDPRDVVVSMYFERTRRERAYDGTLAQFLHERRGSLETILAYYNVWAAQRTRVRAFLPVRYEELRADTRATLRRILAFVGLGAVEDEVLDEAVAFGSFEHMHALEEQGALRSGRLRPRDPADPESFKTRRGQVGGHRDYLTEAERAWMEERIRATLDPCWGYQEPAAPVAVRAP